MDNAQISRKKLLMLGCDGPIVNKAVTKLMNGSLSLLGRQKLVDLGISARHTESFSSKHENFVSMLCQNLPYSDTCALETRFCKPHTALKKNFINKGRTNLPGFDCPSRTDLLTASKDSFNPLRCFDVNFKNGLVGSSYLSSGEPWSSNVMHRLLIPNTLILLA
ncbi:hypothetical protein ACJJTC_009133 [Scirpophaga incertulas]